MTKSIIASTSVDKVYKTYKTYKAKVIVVDGSHIESEISDESFKSEKEALALAETMKAKKAMEV